MGKTEKNRLQSSKYGKSNEKTKHILTIIEKCDSLSLRNK